MFSSYFGERGNRFYICGLKADKDVAKVSRAKLLPTGNRLQINFSHVATALRNIELKRQFASRLQRGNFHEYFTGDDPQKKILCRVYCTPRAGKITDV
jgi:hypothetical protein